jgi:hypothetical protein
MSEDEAVASVGQDDPAGMDDVQQFGVAVQSLATMVQIAALEAIQPRPAITVVQVGAWTQAVAALVGSMTEALEAALASAMAEAERPLGGA